MLSYFELDGELSPMDPTCMLGLKERVREPQQRRLPGAGSGKKGTAGRLACSKDATERDLVLKRVRFAFLGPPEEHRWDLPFEALTSMARSSRFSRPATRSVTQPHGVQGRGNFGRSHAAGRGHRENSPDPELADAAEKTTLFAPPLLRPQAALSFALLRGKATSSDSWRRHQRCSRLASCGHRHLGRHGYRHRPRTVGRIDPARKDLMVLARVASWEGRKSSLTFSSTSAWGEFQLRQHVRVLGASASPFHSMAPIQC